MIKDDARFDNASIKVFDDMGYSKREVLQKIQDFQKYKDKRVLDAGCGTGLDYFDFCLAGAEVIGVDRSKVSLDFLQTQAKRLNVKANTILAELSSIPLPDDSFDIISCRGVLQHTSNPKSVLMEFKRLIRGTGKITITLIIHSRSIEWQLRKIVQKIVGIFTTKGYGNPCLRAFSISELKALCSEVGLKVTMFEVRGYVLSTFMKPLIPPIIYSAIDNLLGKYVGWHIHMECEK